MILSNSKTVFSSVSDKGTRSNFIFSENNSENRTWYRHFLSNYVYVIENSAIWHGHFSDICGTLVLKYIATDFIKVGKGVEHF